MPLALQLSVLYAPAPQVFFPVFLLVVLVVLVLVGLSVPGLLWLWIMAAEENSKIELAPRPMKQLLFMPITRISVKLLGQRNPM